MADYVQPINEQKGPEKKSTELNSPQTSLVAGGIIVSAVLGLYLLFTQEIAQTMLLVLGLLLGYTLFHARFGFTSPSAG